MTASAAARACCVRRSSSGFAFAASVRAIPPERDVIEIVMDLGRRPEARFPNSEVALLEREITETDIGYVVEHIGSFGDDNRAGIERNPELPQRAGGIVSLEKYGAENRKPKLFLSPAAMERLTGYDWPGNVRQLENVIERAVVLCGDSKEIGPELIPGDVAAAPAFEVAEVVIPPDGIDFDEVISTHRRRYIDAALEASGGVQKRAAELLHTSQPTVSRELARLEQVRTLPACV